MLRAAASLVVILAGLAYLADRAERHSTIAVGAVLDPDAADSPKLPPYDLRRLGERCIATNECLGELRCLGVCAACWLDETCQGWKCDYGHGVTACTPSTALE